MGDLSGLKDSVLLWRYKALFYDAGEICELWYTE